MTNEENEILSGNSYQRILRRLISGCQSQSCAIFSSGALSVSLFFQQCAKQVMGLEGTTDVDYTADVSGRLEAGFDRSEVDRAFAESTAKLEENRARRNEQRGNG